MSTDPVDAHVLLEALATSVDARVCPRNHHHPDVAGPFTRVCRFVFAGHPTAWSTNGAVYLIEVEASSDITFAAGWPDRVVGARLPVGEVGGVPVFEAAIGGGSPLRAWLSARVHRRALATLGVVGEERLLVASNRTTMIALPQGAERDRARLEALCGLVDLLPHTARTSSRCSRNLPPGLRPLASLLQRWGIDDDEQRALAIELASDADLAQLWETVDPQLASIDAVLNRGEPRDAALASLAQAALEAHLELQRRRPQR